MKAFIITISVLVAAALVWYFAVYLPSLQARSGSIPAVNPNSPVVQPDVSLLPANQEELFQNTLRSAVVDFRTNNPVYINATDVNKSRMDTIILSIQDNHALHKIIFDQAVAKSISLKDAIHQYIAERMAS